MLTKAKNVNKGLIKTDFLNPCIFFPCEWWYLKRFIYWSFNPEPQQFFFLRRQHQFCLLHPLHYFSNCFTSSYTHSAYPIEFQVLKTVVFSRVLTIENNIFTRILIGDGKIQIRMQKICYYSVLDEGGYTL